ncbi:hypothetical protein [Azospirillum aestuarii]|uniref:hypothetical protein n=1 Tax=Azospirillum aestuarii TaxID=2802052 RepID=UPI004055088A
MPDKPVANLSNMTIGEVAVCRRGMNPGATVALHKADTGAGPPSPSPSTTSEANPMSTPAPGGASPGSTGDPVSKAGDPPAFTPCPDCTTKDACTKSGACASQKPPVAKGVPLVIPQTAPAADPLAKSVTDIMADLFKGVANPPVGLYAGVAKAVADAKSIGAAEVKKATDAIAAGTAALAKADDDDAKTFGQVLPAELAMQDWWRFNDALYTALRSILESSEPDDTKLQMVVTSLEEFKNAIARRMAAAIAAANAATNALLKTGPAGGAAPTSNPTPSDVNKGDPAVSGNNTPNLSDTLAKAATVEDVIKALPECAAKIITDAIAKGAAPAEDPIAKALEASPVLKAQFDALRKAADEATALAKAEKDAREHTARVAKAGTEFGNLPASGEEMAGVLKAMETMDEPVRKTLEAVLKASNEAVGKNVLSGEIGKSGGGGAAAGTALAKAQAKAAELQKADPSLTDAAALEKAFDADAALQAEYLKEMK